MCTQRISRSRWATPVTTCGCPAARTGRASASATVTGRPAGSALSRMGPPSRMDPPRARILPRAREPHVVGDAWSLPARPDTVTSGADLHKGNETRAPAPESPSRPADGLTERPNTVLRLDSSGVVVVRGGRDARRTG